MPVGGIKQKVLAAYRAGIRELILPEENEKDLEEIADDVREEMTYRFVEHMDDVLSHALIDDIEAAVAGPAADGESDYDSSPIAH